MTCPVHPCQHFVVHSVFSFFPPNRPINSFRASRVILPIFTSTFAFRRFITVCVLLSPWCAWCFTRSACPLDMLEWSAFFSPFPSCAEAGRERYCVRTCLCEAFPNSLRNLSANKASFFWLMSRQSVQQCYTLHTNGWLVGCAYQGQLDQNLYIQCCTAVILIAVSCLHVHPVGFKAPACCSF